MSIKKHLLSIACGVSLMALAGIITIVFSLSNLSGILAGWLTATVWTFVHDYIREA